MSQGLDTDPVPASDRAAAAAKNYVQAVVAAELENTQRDQGVTEADVQAAIDDSLRNVAWQLHASRVGDSK